MKPHHYFLLICLTLIIVLSLIFGKMLSYTGYLENQLQSRDSINTINIRNHIKDSTIASEIYNPFKNVE